VKGRDCLYENNNPEAAQPQYGGVPYQNNYAAPVVTTKEWLITMLIMIIPIVNIIMIFVYAFGGSSNPSKANYFKASLIMALIGVVLWILLFLVFGLALSSLFALN